MAAGPCWRRLLESVSCLLFVSDAAAECSARPAPLHFSIYKRGMSPHGWCKSVA